MSDDDIRKGARSCQAKFDEQPYISETSDYDNLKPKQGRVARSFNDNQDEQWNSITEQQKQQIIEQRKKLLKQKSKPPAKQQIKKKIKEQNNQIRGRKFTQELVDSESVSLQESARSFIPQQSLRYEQEPHKPQPYSPKKKQYFNVMLVGASSTGKTTYMNCFLRQYKQHNQKGLILDPTNQIQEHTLNPLPHHLNLQTTLVDTPGYKASTFQNYVKLVVDQIYQRNKKYQEERNHAMRVSSIYEKQERQIHDKRIHCCLLFFRGPRIHSDDWQLLQKLELITNVIPLIAKGDSFTISQIKIFKEHIIERARKESINWFDANQYIRQKYPQALNLLESGPYGKSPPFMIVGSTSKIDGKCTLNLTREYRWGTCYIQNESHTQFSSLNRLLLDYFREGLVKLTQIKFKMLIEDNNTRKKHEKSLSKPLLICAGVGITIFAYWCTKGQIKK